MLKISSTRESNFAERIDIEHILWLKAESGSTFLNYAAVDYMYDANLFMLSVRNIEFYSRTLTDRLMFNRRLDNAMRIIVREKTQR